MLIFLDFDGVLHPTGKEQRHFSCLPIFENAMRQCPSAKIVITSTWRLAYNMDALKRIFSEDIRSRIIGCTPEGDSEDRYARSREIESYLVSEKLQVKWIAIDDSAGQFRPGTALVLTDGKRGFDVASAKKLFDWYLSK